MPQSRFRHAFTSVSDLLASSLMGGGGLDRVEAWWGEILLVANSCPKLNTSISVRPLPQQHELQAEIGKIQPTIDNGFSAQIKSSPRATETPLPSKVHALPIGEHDAFCRFIKRRVETHGRFLGVAQGTQYGQFQEVVEDDQRIKIDAYLHQAEHGRIHVFQLTYLDLQ